MKQLIADLLQHALHTLQTTGQIPATSVEIKIERSKDNAHGDFASNLALLLAKPCQRAPRAIAELLLGSIPENESIERVEIAGAGFINFFVKDNALTQVITQVLEQKDTFGSSKQGQGHKVLLEFVSANPTGPLHVGHGRSAAYGATLGNVLTAVGFEVTNEYYVNDAGRQMDILATSVWIRYLELIGQPVFIPANAYKGSYVIDIAQKLKEEYAEQFNANWNDIVHDLPPDEPQGGDKEIFIDALIAKAHTLLGQEGFNLFHQHALNVVLDDIKVDLAEFGVHYQNWFSEKSLFTDGSIEKGIAALKEAGHTFEKEGALWFKATAFGDEKDRVLVRANGNKTYFASDVAYHWNKYDRGFTRVINVFGADHHGYVPRLRSAVKALGHDDNALSIFLVQFAILYRSAERVQMSTRSGSFVTLRELREEVGNDATRFFYVARKAEQHMDFDLDLAKSRSNENPIYYIQYAHARICSVLRQLQERGLSHDQQQGKSNVDLLKENQEIELMNLLSRYPEVVASAAEFCEPHQIAYYLRELATGLHSYYNAVQLLCEDERLRFARLCLLEAVRQVIFNGLTLLGVTAPESM